MNRLSNIFVEINRNNKKDIRLYALNNKIRNKSRVVSDINKFKRISLIWIWKNSKIKRNHYNFLSEIPNFSSNLVVMISFWICPTINQYCYKILLDYTYNKDLGICFRAKRL